MSQIQKITLSNGVRVLVEPIDHVKSAAIGLWCRTGSRHEEPSEAGITHLIEHMLFKGTETRTSKEIAETIEGQGGSLNAFTDKESTCYYCRVLSDEIKTGVDVLCDMMLHSTIDPDELKREQGVVLEEIKRGQDEPSDFVHELHLEHRWGTHPLGRPIIGSPESVSSFTQSDIKSYMERHYRAESVLLSVAGNVDLRDVVDAAEAILGKIPHTKVDVPPERPSGKAAVNILEKDVEQVHFCIGTDGTSMFDPDYYALVVLDAALGGSMSSRLFQEIREKRGLVYSVGSYTLTYTSGGAFTVYGGTGPQHWNHVQELVRAEFDKVMKDGLADDELVRTKRHISGGIVLALEGMSSRMMRMSRNELNHQRDIPIDETLGKIQAVTNAEIMELANRILDPALVSTTAIGPCGS